MSRTINSAFSELYLFLDKPIYSHKIQKGDVVFPSDQFITIGGIVQKTLIVNLINCLIEQGKRRIISNIKNINTITNSDIKNLVEKSITEEGAILNTLLETSFQKLKNGEAYKFLTAEKEFEENSKDILEETKFFESIDQLKDSISELFSTVMNKEEIIKEIHIRKNLKEKKTDFPSFIENPNPEKFQEFFNFLTQKNYVDAEFSDFSKLFSGMKPNANVFFESALIFQKITILLLEMNFRSQKSYSLERHFSEYINFKNIGKSDSVAKHISNSSKNKSKISTESMKTQFSDFQYFIK